MKNKWFLLINSQSEIIVVASETMKQKCYDEQLERNIDVETTNERYEIVEYFGKMPTVGDQYKNGKIKKKVKKSSPEERIEICRKIVKECQASKIDGMIVDLFTASAIIKVYDNLNEENRKKLREMDLTKMVSVVWKLIQ